MTCETLIALRFKPRSFSISDSFVSISLGLGNFGATLLTNSIVLIFFVCLYENRPVEITVDPWLYWLLCFLADDITFYLMHLISHKVRWFWASHLVHHSSEHFNLFAAVRGAWTGNISGTFIFWIWMPLVGFHPSAIVMMQAISLFYQFILHTEVIRKMPGWFEFIFNSPSNHRVHHGTNRKYLDRNFGGTLIIWDRIFKTYQLEEEDPKYGLTSSLASKRNPFAIAFYGWVSLLKDMKTSTGIGKKLLHLIKSPSWPNKY